jgi:hypothetical protein
MARVDLQCECGHQFFVAEEALSVHRLAPCPACDANVKAPGAAKPGAPKPAAPKVAAKPAAPKPAPAPVEFIDPAPEGGSKKKLSLILGGAGAGVILLVVVLALVFSGPKVDYEKEAAKAVEERKKAFQEISTKTPSPAPAPAPAPAAPVKAPAPAPGPKTSSELRAQRPALPSPAPAPGPQPGTQAAPATTPKVGAVALNADALIRVRTDVLTLHPFYMALVLTPAEKTRLDGIVASGQGLPDDADFIQALLTGGRLKSARDEIGLIVQTLPTVDRESQEGLPLDKITLTDGRVMNCRIIDEGTDVVKVSRTLAGGVGGQLPIRRENITRIEKGKGIGTEFASRWESARKGSLASQVELLGWCKENTLTGQAKLVAFTILRNDPSNTVARAEAGLPADPVKMAEEVSRGGIIVYQGRNWPAKELKEKLLKDGNVLMDGQWYTKKEKMITIPGLFRYERQNDKPLTIGGGNGLLCHDIETVYKMVQDPNAGSLETPEVRYIRRFYAPPMTIGLTGRVPPGVVAPTSTYELDVRLNIDEGLPTAGTPMKADVILSVPVGEPLLEASVITTAEVKAGGSITVYHFTGSGDTEKRTKLYTCDARESGSHVIPPELIRGLSEVNLVAVIEMPAAYIQKVERRHARTGVYKGKLCVTPAVDVVHYRMIPDYKAVLFPSNQNTLEVFRLSAKVAEAAPHLTKLFASNADLLK